MDPFLSLFVCSVPSLPEVQEHERREWNKQDEADAYLKISMPTSPTRVRYRRVQLASRKCPPLRGSLRGFWVQVTGSLMKNATINVRCRVRKGSRRKSQRR